MAVCFVSYDWVKEIIDELKRLGALRMLESNWCLKRSISCESKNSRDHFKKFIDSDDRLVVSEITDWDNLRMMDNLNNL